MNFQQRYSAYETTNFKGMKYNVYKSTNVYPYIKKAKINLGDTVKLGYKTICKPYHV